MRLKETTKISIIKYAKKHFGENIRVYLFGSRVFDEKKGGDIDILIESNNSISLESEIVFLRDIYKNVTTRKIDLLIKTPQRKNISIFDTAKEEGVLLC